MALLTRGITFNVYGATDGVEKIMPFDILPRVVSAAEWKTIERGLTQRVRALNDFIGDVYGARKILAAGVVPESILQSSRGLLPACNGMKPPKGIWCHVVGTDLVRDRDGQIYVLEDNLRCPSGVSYVLENRQVMKRTFPMVFEQLRVRPVDGYAGKLLETLQHLSPIPNPTVVVLTPGVYNSAYFEHSFLAQQMGVELVEGRDLVVMDGRVHMRTTRGFQRVDVIYRRIDDTFLDPDELREDSMLGVKGLLDVYRKGKVALANAPGTGVADDKVIYRYVPAMIEYYLGEKAILPNVPTFVCADDADRRTVLDDLAKFVVKPANESGGYGIVIGPQGHAAAARGVPLAYPHEPARIHRAAHDRPVASTDDRGRRDSRSPRRSAPVCALRRRYLRIAGRPHARRAARRIADRELVAGRRQQGHVGDR